MPVNRNALVRYKTIDNCLRNRYRKWTLDDLIDACSDALYEYEGIDKGVSRRTVQMDIQVMRSEKLGYNAPIVVADKKYYTYEDPEYSITNIPLTDQDLGTLNEVAQILRQFKGFAHFRELTGMVQRLEDKIHTSQTHEHPIIDLETNENLKGLEHIDTLYQAILRRECIVITYQSFKARNAQDMEFHPCLLKEYRNRWFVLGKRKPSMPYILLALDRMESIKPSSEPHMGINQKEIKSYFEHVVGVSVNPNDPPSEVHLFIYHSNAPYVLTKPIHHSQELVEKNAYGVIVSFNVQLNFEFEREILGFGDRLKVLKPARFRRRIKDLHSHSVELYLSELDELALKNFDKRLAAKGHIISKRVYTTRELNRIRKTIHSYQQKLDGDIRKQLTEIPRLLPTIPSLKGTLISHNLKRMLENIDPHLFMIDAVFYIKIPQSPEELTWRQITDWDESVLDNIVEITLFLDEVSPDEGGLKILPGSHKQLHSKESIRLITENSMPATFEVGPGSVHIMKPLLLRKRLPYNGNKKKRTIVMRFASVELPDGKKWEDRLELG